MNLTERRQQLRAILAGDQCVYAAPVHDPISARIAEDLGFEVGFVSDRVIPATVLCVPPDTGLLTLTEQAQHFRNMCRATNNISLVTVAREGYGHALNVMRTVEELENAGVSAIQILDSEMPLRFGSPETPPTEIPLGDGKAVALKLKHMTPLEEMVGKLKAALAARQDPNLVITVKAFALRDETLRADPELMREFIRRVEAYEKAGADAIHMIADTREAIEAIQGATKLPLLLGYGTLGKPGVVTASQEEDKQYLASKGVRIVNPGHFTVWAAAKAAHAVLKGLRDGKSIEELRKAHYSPELEDRVVIRRPQYDEWVKRFMN